ncbi:MAG: hexitol phosphatase HxpB [Sporocytophaga sp.]|uniref:hexitol phosphatase HxpB n=1 Tax=Sporocytophaga sp. TaxID=2231183 RepID=UPI001B25F589|nr:hexitol phosphatase HxpB [Sporocytophaga sp.]MBO9702631.1 hexitol phosphatase HxpB [Sporocytophaga sp.]
MTMIKAVIFDMDGILIDSEPLWKIAEKKAFAKVGLIMSTEMCNLTMGYRINEVTDYWYERRPWKGKSKDEVTEDIIQTVIDEIKANGNELKGVKRSLRLLKEQNYKIALASSSAMRIINVVVDKLEIREYFDSICSAETEPYGKPHPAVFITAADKLKIDPHQCLVIEDSVNGVIAGKAARMKVVAIPDESLSGDKRFIIADTILPDLDHLTLDLIRSFS